MWGFLSLMFFTMLTQEDLQGIERQVKSWIKDNCSDWNYDEDYIREQFTKQRPWEVSDGINSQWEPSRWIRFSINALPPKWVPID